MLFDGVAMGWCDGLLASHSRRVLFIAPSLFHVFLLLIVYPFPTDHLLERKQLFTCQPRDLPLLNGTASSASMGNRAGMATRQCFWWLQEGLLEELTESGKIAAPKARLSILQLTNKELGH